MSSNKLIPPKLVYVIGSSEWFDFSSLFLFPYADLCSVNTNSRSWCLPLVGWTRYNARHCEASSKLQSEIFNSLFINYEIYCKLAVALFYCFYMLPCLNL